MARNPIVFSNGTLVSNAKVNVGGTIYDVEPAQYEGTTPLSASNMNQLQTNLYDHIDEEIEETNSKIQQDFTTDGQAVKCGYKIDNKDVYVKRINFGALPNSSSKTVATGIDFNTHTLIKIEGVAKFSTNNIAFALPLAHPSTLGYSIMVNIDNSNNLAVTTGSDRSGYNAWFNIYYI